MYIKEFSINSKGILAIKALLVVDVEPAKVEWCDITKITNMVRTGVELSLESCPCIHRKIGGTSTNQVVSPQSVSRP